MFKYCIFVLSICIKYLYYLKNTEILKEHIKIKVIKEMKNNKVWIEINFKKTNSSKKNQWKQKLFIWKDHKVNRPLYRLKKKKKGNITNMRHERSLEGL